MSRNDLTKQVSAGLYTMCMITACCLLAACHRPTAEQETQPQQESEQQSAVVAPKQADSAQPQDTIVSQKAASTLTDEQREKLNEMKQFILDTKLQELSKDVKKNLNDINQLFDLGARLNKQAFLNAMENGEQSVDVFIQHAVADHQLKFSPICEAVRANNMYAAEKLKDAGADIKDVSDECIVEMISKAESASPLIALGVEKVVLARALANVDDDFLTQMVDRFKSIKHILKAGISEERFKSFAQKNVPLWEAQKKKAEDDAKSLAEYDALDMGINDLDDEAEKIGKRIAKVKTAGYGSESAASEPPKADNNPTDTENVVANKTASDSDASSSTSADSTDKPSIPNEKTQDTDDSNQMIADNEDVDGDDASEEDSKCTSLFGMMENEQWWDGGNYYETDEDAIRKCIKDGANVNERDALGRTPIFEAFMEETIDILLENGADINAKDNKGLTPIMAAGVNRAVSSTYKAIHLIKKGAKVDIRDKKGQNILFKRLAETQYTPITYSPADYTDEEWRREFVNNEIELLELILSKGPDVNVKDKLGRTPVFYLEHPEGVEFFKSHGVDINAQDNNGQTALMVTHNLKVLIVLLAAGADVSIKDKSDQTVFDIHKDEDKFLQTLKYPFHHCELCSTEVLSSLGSHGFDINAKDQNNKTALETAMAREDFDSVFALIKAGADSNIIGSSGDPILFDLIKIYSDDVEDDINRNHFEASDLEELVAQKANVNLKNHDGKTPLMLLCNAESDFVQKLIDAGADLNAVDNQGRNALYYAGTCLEKYHSFWFVLFKEEQKILDILLKPGTIDLAHRDNQLQSPLVTHDLFAANILAKAGFDINEKYKDGTTPFFMVLANHLKRVAYDSQLLYNHCESKSNNPNSMIQLIAQLQPQINEMDNLGRTPLLYMLDTNTNTCWHGHPQCNTAEYMMVSALIANHADVNLADHEGRSPLMLAKCMDTAQLLVEKGAYAPISEGNWKLLLNSYADCMKEPTLGNLQHLELMISQFESSH